MPPWLRALDAIDAGLTTMSMKDLRALAGTLRIVGRAAMKQDDLILAITAVRPGPREAGWQELSPTLEGMQVITPADVHALAITIDAYVGYIEVQRTLAEIGPTYSTDGRYGLQVKRRPEVEIASRRWEQVMRGLIEFGMTPASRSRIAAIPYEAEESPLDMLRKRGAAHG